MLSRAVQKQERLDKSPSSSSSDFRTSSHDVQPFLRDSPNMMNSAAQKSTSAVGGKSVPPGRTTSSSYFQRQATYPSGVHGTSSQGRGLIGKLANQDSFQENRPPVIDLTQPESVTQLRDVVYFDLDDFEDDADLDLDADSSKSHLTPDHVAPRFTSSSKPVQPNLDLAPVDLLAPPASGPIPWSSSPAYPRQASGRAVVQLLSDAESSDGFETAPLPKVQQDEVVTTKEKKKKRSLFWKTAEESAEADGGHVAKRQDLQGRGGQHMRLQNTTPALTPSKTDPYPWNKTASAVKAEQKGLRQKSKNLSRATDDFRDDAEATSPTKKLEGIQPLFLSSEQEHVLKLVVEGGKSVFFTGSAGTGKSVLMREIIRRFREKYVREPDRVAVTASTGLAACNIGGVTLHSFSGIGLGKESAKELISKIKKNAKAKNRWLRTKVLIIDEISMVDGELFDKLEEVAQKLRGNGRPFGGIQLVITGDFFQLPPVPDKGKIARFAFEASTWSTSINHTIALTQVFRQKDPTFAAMLNEMRVGKLTQASIDAFRALTRPISYADHLEATELFPTRAEVDRANAMKMRMLKGESQIYHARDGGMVADKMHRDRLLKDCMAPPMVELKVGAQVMLIKNTDAALVNGSLGKIVGFTDEKTYELSAKVQEEDSESTDPTFDEGNATGSKISRHMANLDGDSKKSLVSTGRKWPLVCFSVSNGSTRTILIQEEQWRIELPNGEVQASRMQVPLILAWALSIHKAQGQTMERVKVDLGKIFEKGQAYVALSRATCQEGLQVSRFDPRKVMAHDKVRGFYEGLSSFDASTKKAANKLAQQGGYEDQLDEWEEQERMISYG